MTAAAVLARPVQTLLDLGVESSTSAAGLCARLDGRTLAVRTGNASLDFGFAVADGRLVFTDSPIDEPDATIHAAPLTLLRMLAGDAQPIIRSGQARISGSTEVAEDLQALLRFVRPDLEEELSKLTGDVVAHEVGNLARAVSGWLRGARRSLGRSVSEYLQEESRDLVTRTEVDEFCAGVDAVASGVDRAEARLRLVREKLGKAESAS